MQHTSLSAALALHKTVSFVLVALILSKLTWWPSTILIDICRKRGGLVQGLVLKTEARPPVTTFSALCRLQTQLISCVDDSFSGWMGLPVCDVFHAAGGSTGLSQAMCKQQRGSSPCWLIVAALHTSLTTLTYWACTHPTGPVSLQLAAV